MGDFAEMFYPDMWARYGIDSMAALHGRCVEWAAIYRADVARMHDTARAAAQTRWLGAWAAAAWLWFFIPMATAWGRHPAPMPLVVLLVLGSGAACVSAWNAARCHELVVRARTAARDLTARAEQWDAHAAYVHGLMHPTLTPDAERAP